MALNSLFDTFNTRVSRFNFGRGGGEGDGRRRERVREPTRCSTRSTGG